MEFDYDVNLWALGAPNYEYKNSKGCYVHWYFRKDNHEFRLRMTKARYVWISNNGYPKLPKRFFVVHLNHDPFDDRIENLAIMDNSDAAKHFAKPRNINTVIHGITHRKCSSCKRLLTLDRFRKRYNHPGILNSQCKKCAKVAVRLSAKKRRFMLKQKQGG